MYYYFIYEFYMTYTYYFSIYKSNIYLFFVFISLRMTIFFTLLILWLAWYNESFLKWKLHDQTIIQIVHQMTIFYHSKYSPFFFHHIQCFQFIWNRPNISKNMNMTWNKMFQIKFINIKRYIIRYLYFSIN